MVEATKVALNNTPFGVVVVSDDYRVIFLNSMAQELVDHGCGLTIRSGVLTATDLQVNVTLRHRIELAAGRAPGCRRSARSSAIRIRRDEGSSLMVLVVPLPRSEAGLTPDEPAAMVLMSDPDRQRKPIGRHLIDWFGLSQAEATLAVQLADGVRLESLAEQRRVRISTLRSQLSVILSKTGTTRQPELIRLLHQLPMAYQQDHGD